MDVISAHDYSVDRRISHVSVVFAFAHVYERSSAVQEWF